MLITCWHLPVACYGRILCESIPLCMTPFCPLSVLTFSLHITFFLKVVDIRTFFLYFSWLLHLLSFQMLSIDATRRVLRLNEVILWVLGPNVVPGDQFQSYFLLDEPSKLFSPMHVGQWMNCKCCFHFFFLCLFIFNMLLIDTPLHGNWWFDYLHKIILLSYIKISCIPVL